MPFTMRRFVESRLRLFALLVALGTGAAGAAESTEADILTVYKHPLCFCCKKWIEHLNREGIGTRVVNSMDMSEVKGRWGLPRGMESCHTAIWHDQYVFEGHVPARYIRQYLEKPPEGSFGLTVPGMPAGSPGMYNGGDFEPYNIYLLLRGGDYRFFARVEEAESQ